MKGKRETNAFVATRLDDGKDLTCQNGLFITLLLVVCHTGFSTGR